MGIKNSPDIFQKKIAELMSGFKGYVQVYLDDILIITKGIYKDHLRHLNKVLMRLTKAGLQVNLPKSKLAIQECEYLGYWLMPKAIHPMANKVEAIKNLQPPKTLKQVRSLLGMITIIRTCSNISHTC